MTLNFVVKKSAFVFCFIAAFSSYLANVQKMDDTSFLQAYNANFLVLFSDKLKIEGKHILQNPL